MATSKPILGSQIRKSLTEHIETTYGDASSSALKTALTIAARAFTRTNGLVISNVRAAYATAVRTYVTDIVSERATAATEAASSGGEATATISTIISRATFDTAFYKLFLRCCKTFPILITTTSRNDHRLLRQQITYELFSFDREQMAENPDITRDTSDQRVVADGGAGIWDLVWKEVAAREDVRLSVRLVDRTTEVEALEVGEGIQEKLRQWMKEWEDMLRLEAVRQQVLWKEPQGV